MANIKSLFLPLRDVLINSDSLITRSWQVFFRDLTKVINSLGIEQSFTLLNNQTTSQFITGLSFDSEKDKCIFCDYLIQRITSSSELIEAGLLRIVYLSSSNTWNLSVVGSSGPHSSGVTFSITTDGKIKYTSTNVGGTPVLFKLSTRSRVMSGVNLVWS